MTEKIFTFHGIDATTIEVYENGEIIAEFCHSMTCANGVEILCNRLNNLHEELQEEKEKHNQFIKELLDQ